MIDEEQDPLMSLKDKEEGEGQDNTCATEQQKAEREAVEVVNSLMRQCNTWSGDDVTLELIYLNSSTPDRTEARTIRELNKLLGANLLDGFARIETSLCADQPGAPPYSLQITVETLFTMLTSVQVTNTARRKS